MTPKSTGVISDESMELILTIRCMDEYIENSIELDILTNEVTSSMCRNSSAEPDGIGLPSAANFVCIKVHRQK